MNYDTADQQVIATLPFILRLPPGMHQRMSSILLSISERNTCDSGESVIREGDIGGASGFVLLKGRVNIQRSGEEPLSITAPTLLGEMYQFNPHTSRTATVACATDCALLSFSWQDLYAQARKNFTEEEQQQILESLEHIVLERVDILGLWSLPLFAGLPEALRVRAAILLLWLGRHKTVSPAEMLFEQDTLCGNHGFLLIKGELQLNAGGQQITRVTAPDVVGVMPRFDPDRRWSASAKAIAPVEVLAFSWIDYLRRLEARLSAGEYQAFLTGIESSAPQFFQG